MPADSLPVEHLFTLSLTSAMDQIYQVENGPAGTRLVVSVTGGKFDGPKLSGTVAPLAGGDWLILRADQSARLDVRIVLLTNDGAVIYMQYGGIGSAADGKLRSAPLFETGDTRYAWLNNVQGVGVGSVTESGPVYEVYALV
jgi:hypothetical protein